MRTSISRLSPLAAVVLLASLSLFGAINYGNFMQQKVKAAVGGDFKDYQWLSYPTNNFGLVTAFVLAKPRARPSDKNEWCATFTCLGMDDKQMPTTPAEILSVANYPSACREYYIGRLVLPVFRREDDLEGRLAIARARAQ